MNAVVNFLVGFPLAGLALPLLTALLVKESTHAGWKGATTGLLAVVVGVASQAYEHAVHHTAYSWHLGLATALVGYLYAQAVHYGIWKPSGLATLLQRVGLPKGLASSVSAKAETSVSDLKAKLEARDAAQNAVPADPGTEPASVPVAVDTSLERLPS